MKKSKILYLSLLMGILILLISCGSPEFPTHAPTPTFIPQAIPTPTPTPVLQSAAIRRAEEFNSIDALISAYADGSNDQSFTPYSLLKNDAISDGEIFPRITAALIDFKGNLVTTFGSGGEALLIDKFAVTPSIVMKYASIDPQTLTPEVIEAIFPKNYNLLLPKDKLDMLKGALSSKISIDELDIPPSLPLEIQVSVLEFEYVKNIVPRSAILEFGLRPDGSKDYEILKKSIARDDGILFEIFERNPNPSHPFPKEFIFETMGFEKLSKRDRLIFNAHSYGIAGIYTRTTKRASISTLYPDRSIIAVNGPVTPGNFGALVFAMECGKQKLIGMTIGSLLAEGKENQAYAVGIDRIIEFVQARTGITVKLPEYKDVCPETNPVLKQRAINAISDTLYDFSYDLCHLASCNMEDIEKWIRPLEVVRIWKEDPSLPETIGTPGRAILIGKYVFALTSAVNIWFSPEQPSDSNTELRYRIAWDAAIDAYGKSKVEYEYLNFVAFDSTKRVAMFERPVDTKFPVSEDMPFPIGISSELKVGNVLYTLGAVDFRIFEQSSTAVLRPANDPAYVIGRSPGKDDRFHFQGSGKKVDTGGPICALRDGKCEVVGFVFSDLASARDETLSTALTVEVVINAIREILCQEGLGPCIYPPVNSLAIRGFGFTTAQVRADRQAIIELLMSSSLPPPLIADILKLDISALTRHEKQLVIFLVDETGSIASGTAVMYRAATVLSNEYVLTAASSFSLPPMYSLVEEVPVPDRSDIRSGVVVSGAGKKLEIRAALVDKFISAPDALWLFKEIPFIVEVLENISDSEFLVSMTTDEFTEFSNRLRNTLYRNGTSRLVEEISRRVDEILHQNQYNPESLQNLLRTKLYQDAFREIISQMEILEISLIDRANGYALLKRSTPIDIDMPFIGDSFNIVAPKDISEDREIFIVYSHDIFIFEGSLTRIGLISPGTSAYAEGSSPLFIFNGIVSERNLGAPIYMKCAETICLLGIVAKTSILPEKIQTEGLGLPISFVLEKIKEKTGLDLSTEVTQKDN